MKNLVKITLIFLFTIISGIFTNVFAETYNVNDELNLGQYNIYFRQGASYIRYNGVGQLNYMYYYKDYNNVEHKAFCLNLGMVGAESGDYLIDANRLIEDPKVASILISGSPYKTLAELGLNNEDEASFATQFAVWIYLNNLNINLITPYASGNENVVEAIKKIYYDGMNMNYTSEAILKIDKVNGVVIDSKDSSYYSQTYKIEYNDNIKNVTLSTMGIDNVKIVDLNNNEISDLSNVTQFKVLIPRSSVTQDKELLLNFRAQSKQTSVMFGATNIADRQNMGLLLDPVNFRNVQDRFSVSYKATKINITKVDKDTGVLIAGVTFRFETLDGKNLGEFTTNENGVIDLDVQKNLNIVKEQQIKVTEIAVPSNYNIDTENNSQIVDIKWEQNISLTFKNEKKKGQVKVIKVDLDNNEVKLKGVTFNVLDSKGNIVDILTTNENGEAITKMLPIDETYRVQETKILSNYVLNSEEKIITLKENQITNVTFTNEKKKGQIKVVKVDLDNNEVKLKGVTFNVLDSKDNVVDTLITNDKGEATTKMLPIDETYRVQETKTLSNYVLNSEVKTVTLKQNQITNITFTNELRKGQIKVIKVDYYNNEIKLNGVKFNILDESDNIVDTLITNENGEAVSKRLRVDKQYKIQEIETLKDYELNSEVKTITLKENEITNVTFTNELKKGKIKVIKVDLDNQEIRLKGVEFKIFDEDNNLIDTLVTDDRGEATSKDLRVDKQYTIQETKTLSNYVLNQETKTITLKPAEIKNITFTNEKIKGKIKILKYSSQDNKYTSLLANTPLKDVVFEIVDSNNKVVDTITTNEEGVAITKDLVKGVYKVREVKQADYYLLNEEVFEIEIKKHKEVIEQVIYNDSVDIDIEIEKTGFIETQNKDNIFYNFKNIHNKSNVSLDNFTWNDILPIEAVRLDKIYTGTWNEKLEYSVWYKTNKEDFKLFEDNLDTEIVYELDFNNLKLQEDEYITEFEFRFGTVKIDFHEVESPIVYVNMLDNLKNGYTFTNNTKVLGNYLEEYIEDTDKWTTIIYNKEVKLNKELPKTGI